MKYLAILGAALTVAACGGDTDPAGPGGPDDDPSPTGPVSATVDPSGGSLSAVTTDGVQVTLTFPPDAVRAPTRLTLRPMTTPDGRMLQVALEPAGTVFRRAYTLRATLPDGVDLTDARLLLGPSDGSVPLATVVDPARRTLTTTALTFFGISADEMIPPGGALLRVDDGNVIGAGALSCADIVATAEAEFDAFLTLGLHRKAVGAALAADAALQEAKCTETEGLTGAAATVACDQLAAAVTHIRGTTIGAHGELERNVEALVDWFSLVQLLSNGCAAEGDVASALGEEIADFLEFISGRLGSLTASDYASYLDMKDEARGLVQLTGIALQLGAYESAEAIETGALRPVAHAMRTAAYRLCRDNGWHYPLSRLMPGGFYAPRDIIGLPARVVRDVPGYAGITAADIAADLQYCGTDLTLETLDSKDDVIATARAGSGGAPAVFAADPVIDATTAGTLRISGDLAGFTCWDGSAADAAIVLELAGVAVHTLQRPGTDGYLDAGPVELDIAALTAAAGISPAAGESDPLVLRRLRTGCDPDLWGPEEFELVTATVNWQSDALYREDFEGGTAGTEWSSTTVTTSPTGVSFLGPFAQGSVSLALSDLPAHGEVTISFDLYVIDDWNGNGDENSAADVVTFAADGQVLLTTSFSNHPGNEQAYPGAHPGAANPPLTGSSATGTLGITPDADSEGAADATYRVSFTLPHASSSLSFSVAGNPTSEAELWGIDNVEVTAND